MIELITPGSCWRHTTLGYLSTVDKFNGRVVVYRRNAGSPPFKLGFEQFLIAYAPHMVLVTAQ